MSTNVDSQYLNMTTEDCFVGIISGLLIVVLIYCVINMDYDNSEEKKCDKNIQENYVVHTGVYPYKRYCNNCGELGRTRCGECLDCGFCYTPDGNGECVPGDENGPYFREDCVDYEYMTPAYIGGIYYPRWYHYPYLGWRYGYYDDDYIYYHNRNHNHHNRHNHDHKNNHDNDHVNDDKKVKRRVDTTKSMPIPLQRPRSEPKHDTTKTNVKRDLPVSSGSFKRTVDRSSSPSSFRTSTSSFRSSPSSFPFRSSPTSIPFRSSPTSTPFRSSSSTVPSSRSGMSHGSSMSFTRSSGSGGSGRSSGGRR
jgi:hypothetical protein